jgi:hypothetical protein
MRRDIDRLLDDALGQTRREGYDWGRIGRLLGVSRQAARQRFRGLAPTVPPGARRRNRHPAAIEHEELRGRFADHTRELAVDRLADGEAVPW